MTRENPARIRYDRDELEAVLRNHVSGISDARVGSLLSDYESRRAMGKDKPCQVRLWHGPGHQSSSFCEVRGNHEKNTDHAWNKYWPEDAEIHYVGNTEFIEADPYARDY